MDAAQQLVICAHQSAGVFGQGKKKVKDRALDTHSQNTKEPQLRVQQNCALIYDLQTHL